MLKLQITLCTSTSTNLFIDFVMGIKNTEAVERHFVLEGGKPWLSIDVQKEESVIKAHLYSCIKTFIPT